MLSRASPSLLPLKHNFTKGMILSMAIYHFYLKNGKNGNGKLHCDYINREGRYGSAKMKEELVHKECGNLPFWAQSASEFFDNADVYERSNGNSYSEFEVGLQEEFTLEENIELIKKLINEHIGSQKVWAFAVHEKMATLEENQRQPHAHIMFSERIITDESKYVKFPSIFFRRYNPQNPELGGYEKDNRFSKNKHISSENLSKVREFWQDINNEALSKKGLDVRISCKTLEYQKEEALEQLRKISCLLLKSEQQLTALLNQKHRIRWSLKVLELLF